MNKQEINEEIDVILCCMVDYKINDISYDEMRDKLEKVINSIIEKVTTN